MLVEQANQLKDKILIPGEKMQKEIRLEKVLMELLVSMAGKLITKNHKQKEEQIISKTFKLYTGKKTEKKVIIISF